MGATPRSLLSLVLASPAILIALCGLLLLVEAPFTWGVAAHMGMPDRLITVSLLIVALPVLFIGVSTTWQILAYTSRPFHVFPLHLPFAVFLPAAAFVLLVLASRVTDPHTYDNLQREDQPTSPGAVLGMTIVVAPFGLGMLWGCAYMYSETFSERRLPPRPPDERWFTN